MFHPHGFKPEGHTPLPIFLKVGARIIVEKRKNDLILVKLGSWRFVWHENYHYLAVARPSSGKKSRNVKQNIVSHYRACDLDH
jgi:hypothetical protein